MKTTFDRRSPRSASRFAAKHAWWTISAEVMSLRNPSRRSRRNRKPRAHPDLGGDAPASAAPRPGSARSRPPRRPRAGRGTSPCRRRGDLDALRREPRRSGTTPRGSPELLRQVRHPREIVHDAPVDPPGELPGAVPLLPHRARNSSSSGSVIPFRSVRAATSPSSFYCTTDILRTGYAPPQGGCPHHRPTAGISQRIGRSITRWRR